MKTIVSLIMLISFFSFLNFSYSKSWNCKNISYLESLTERGDFFEDNKIYKKNIYNTALKNLKKYCEWDASDVLKTDIFINHIIDVGFRVLDWFWWKYSYGEKSDPKSKEWRDYLNTIMKDYNHDPNLIKQKFEELWWNASLNIIWNENTIYWRYLLFKRQEISEETL